MREVFYTLREMLAFIKQRGKWWLIPLFIFIGIFGSLLFLTEGSALAPFIYTLF